MARLPRIVVPGQPRHVIQSVNNRQNVLLGSGKFKAQIEALTQRQVSSKGVGRPRMALADA